MYFIGHPKVDNEYDTYNEYGDCLNHFLNISQLTNNYVRILCVYCVLNNLHCI